MAALLRIFVYGTLKIGEPNHYILCDQALGKGSLLSKAMTKHKYPLVVASDCNIPYMLPVPGKGEHVLGEVYEVDKQMLDSLDDLESHPKGYTRSPIQCISFDEKSKDETLDCEAYFLTDFKNHLLDLPFLKSYTSHPMEPVYYSNYKPKIEREKDIMYYYHQVKHVS